MEFSRRNSFDATQEKSIKSSSPRKHRDSVNMQRRGSRREYVLKFLDKKSKNFADDHKGPKLYNSKGLLDPLNLQPFLKDCYKKLTSNDILDLLFFCKFDFEASLTTSSKEAFLSTQGEHWLVALHSKWLQRK
jgi:hypothetical protein